MVRVKICGITNLEDAKLAERLGADALGFIFTKKSPRYIKEAQVKKIISSLGPFISKVGVFMDQEKSEVLEIAESTGIDTLQFHGKETASYCNFFKSRHQFKVIKVCFRNQSIKNTARYKNLDAIMFDIPYQQKQKEKKTLSDKFLETIKKEIKKGKRIILSGGLDVENVEGIIKLYPYGVDVTSGTEELVGKKNEKLVKKFIEKVKNVST
ncbi:MAG: phosphoribosylanthranilate isomerase [Candidatus Omnitrophica bacterium]|nr:phosphoribosylanthranilate isomerase [Candidatus Omnitrophota bacterium]